MDTRRDPLPTPFLRRADAVLAASALFLAVAVLWAVPRQVSDLYMALAGGRDVAGGGLLAPDDWAFTTAGRVWLNQAWLTDLLFFASWSIAGETALLVLKAVLIAIAAACVVAASRERGVPWPLAALVAAGVLLAARGYVDLRPNLVTLALAPLVLSLLYRSRRDPRAPWVVVVVLALWANAHGGFILGLAMLGLWCTCRLLAATFAGEPAARRDARGQAVVLAAAVVVTAFASPYGIENLAHPFVVATSATWRRVDEWQPLFASGRYGSGAWELAAFLGILVVGVAWRLLGSRRVAAGASGADGRDAACDGFDLCLAVALVAMALRSRRFVPLALLLLAPVCAFHIHLLPARVAARMRLAGAVVVCALALSLVPGLVRHYRGDNPLYPPETTFERMTFADRFPAGAVQFLIDNDVAGRVYNEWEWEGYIRWRAPLLKVFVGGRAQAVYLPDTPLLWERIGRAQEVPVPLLRDLDVHLVLVPLGAKFAALTAALVDPSDGASAWSYVYVDGQHAVVAARDTPGGTHLVERAAAGTLTYPRAAVAALSRAMCLSSDPHASGEEMRALLVDAAAHEPMPLAYAQLGDLAANGRIDVGDTVRYLEGERDRLARSPIDVAGGVEVVRMRAWVEHALASLYPSLGREEDAARSARRGAELMTLVGTTSARWSPPS